MKKLILLLALISSFAFGIEKKTPGGTTVKDKPGQSQGTIVPEPTMMSDIQATRLGKKQYYHGTTYNGGNAPTVTLAAGGGSLSSVVRAVFIPYITQDSIWRMKYEMRVTLSSAVRTGVTMAVNGVTTLNLTNYHQPVYCWALDAGTIYAGYCDAPKGSSNVADMAHASATTTLYTFGGDIELNSKPSWAY